jgi:replicative DNA helicase
MSADVNLLSLFFHSRDTFDRFESAVPEHLLEDETRMLLSDLRIWYDNHKEDTSIPDDKVFEFWEWIKLVRHSSAKPEKLRLLKRMLGRAMQQKGKSKANEILKMLTLRDHAGRIAEKADRFSAGDSTVNLFDELMDDVEAAKKDAGLHDEHELEVTASFESIVTEVTDLGSGLNWRSPNLNMALGPIRKGNFIVLAAFVDSGKSTCLSSEVTYMASQLEGDEKVLFFNNEEEGKIVKLRLLMSATGKTLDEIKADVPSAVAEYRDHMNGDPQRIVVVDSPRVSTGLIRRKLRQYNTKLIAIDQLYKVKGFKRYGDDKLGQLQDIFEYGRSLAKEHCPVIAIHQARGDANGVQFIEMHQMAGSQQAIQGEADAIITIGRDLETPNARYIYVPKNKLPTPGDPEMRNIKVEVWPKFNRGRFDE